MKCIIVYSSQTGNTEKIAKAIHAGVKQAAGNCDLFKIKEAPWRRLYEYDLIGLGGPVYGFVETLDVQNFIKKMRWVGGKHVFPFCTHATVGEYFFPNIIPKLKRKGLVVVGMHDSYAAVYMQGLNEKCPTGGHPDEIDLKEAEEFGREVVERSRRIYAGETDLIPPVPEPPMPGGVKAYLKDRQKREMEMGMPRDVAVRKRPAKKVDKKKCTYPECRLCMDICPMDGIDLSVKPPIIAKPCIGCSMCEFVCPTGAFYRDAPIFGGGRLPESATKTMHEEFYLKPLAKAEEEGHFRRLVPLEEIVWETPRSDPDKHPKWVIGKGFV